MAKIVKPVVNLLAPEMALPHVLNFSRGTAALLVLLFHIRTTLVVPYESLQARNALARAVYAVSTFGHDAVIVFFALSGFLVGGAVLRADIASSRDICEYSVDRGVRIGPVLVAATVFSIFLQRMMPLSGCADNAVTLIGNVFALQNILVKLLCNNLPLWSIFNEVVYYFVFPVLVAVVARAFTVWLAISLTCVVLICILSLSLTPLDDTTSLLSFRFGSSARFFGFCRPGSLACGGWHFCYWLQRCCSAGWTSAKAIFGFATLFWRRRSRFCC